MDTWKQSTVTGDLMEVPGIGPAAIKKLRDHEDETEQITNTYQLFGKFLMLKGPETEDEKCTPVMHADKFWYWLQERGITAHRSAIVRAVCEKLSNGTNMNWRCALLFLFHHVSLANKMLCCCSLALTAYPGLYDPNEYNDDED